MSLRPNARTEVRRSRYKVAVDVEEGRRRREDNMVEIWKKRKAESLQKKRREGLQAAQKLSTSAPSFSILDKKNAILPLKYSCKLRSFPVLFNSLAERIPPSFRE